MQSFTWIYCGRWFSMVLLSGSAVFFFGGSTDVGTKDLTVASYPHDVPTKILGYPAGLGPGHGLKVLSSRTMMMRRRWTWENGLSLWSKSLGTWYWCFAAWEAHLRDYDLAIFS